MSASRVMGKLRRLRVAIRAIFAYVTFHPDSSIFAELTRRLNPPSHIKLRI